jgi:hypothetical protein
MPKRREKAARWASLAPGDPGGMGLAGGGHAAGAAEPQDRLAAPWDRLNPCSWIGLARRNYRLKLPVRQVQMPESEPATWRRLQEIADWLAMTPISDDRKSEGAAP